MKHFSEYLYRRLLQKLNCIQAKDLPAVKKAESCFLQCVHYWMKLVEKARSWTFTCQQEEILFFKYQKPLFTTEVSYYNLVYHAVLFKPSDPELQKEFWLREQERIKMVYKTYEGFYAYYKQNRSCRDGEYFCMEKGSLVDFLFVPHRLSSATLHYDLLLSHLQASERYEIYVREQLQLPPD